MKVAHRFLLLAALMTLTGTIFAGCGGNKDADTASSAPVGKPADGSGPVMAGKPMSDGGANKMTEEGGKVPMAK